MKIRGAPFKKTYKAGEKIYRLIVWQDAYANDFKIKIVHNTIKSIHGPNSYPRFMGDKNYIQLKHDNYGYGWYDNINNIAPRTTKGRNFLNKKAHKTINTKINQLIVKIREYRKQLYKF